MWSGVARFAGLIGAAVLGIGFTAWALWPAEATPAAGVHLRRAGSASIVHLDGEGRPIVPEHPPDMGALSGSDEAVGTSAGLEDLPQPEPAPGGGEMIVVGDRLRHYSVARRGTDTGLQVGCERDLPRRGDTAGDE